MERTHAWLPVLLLVVLGSALAASRRKTRSPQGDFFESFHHSVRTSSNSWNTVGGPASGRESFHQSVRTSSNSDPLFQIQGNIPYSVRRTGGSFPVNDVFPGSHSQSQNFPVRDNIGYSVTRTGGSPPADFWESGSENSHTSEKENVQRPRTGGLPQEAEAFRRGQATGSSAAGDACKLQNGDDGVCRSLPSCNAMRNKEDAVFCPFKSTPVVCCPIDPNHGAKANKMCRKYADAVFVWEILPLVTVDAQYGRLNSCAITNKTDSVLPRQAGPHEFPHVALIGYKSGNWRCTGSLISERYILTAANCVTGSREEGPPVLVRLGDLNLNNDNERDNKHEDYDVEEVFQHPEFNEPYYHHNVGLIKVDRDINFTRSIRPACLDTRPFIKDQDAIAAMWTPLSGEIGEKEDETLGRANLKLKRAAVCDRVVMQGSSTFHLLWPHGFQGDTLLCAVDVQDGNATCVGESGSPLQTKLNTPYCMYSIIGIKNFASACGYAGYTRVSYYVPWIESIVWPRGF